MKVITVLAAILLILHGLIHLIGTVVYTKLGTVKGLSYKTTLLGGRWDLGEGGIFQLQVCPADPTVKGRARSFEDLTRFPFPDERDRRLMCCQSCA